MNTATEVLKKQNRTSLKNAPKTGVNGFSKKQLFLQAKEIYQAYTYKNYQQKIEKLTPDQLSSLYDFFSEGFVKEEVKSLFVENGRTVGICSVKPFNILNPILNTHSFLVRDFYASQQLSHQKRLHVYSKLIEFFEQNLPKKNFISARIPSDDSAAVEILCKSNFRYITSETLFYKPISEKLQDEAETSEVAHIRPFRDEDLPSVKAIASENHDISKFHCDQTFDNKQTEAIYLSTLEQSLKSPRHHIFVHEKNNEIGGFVTVIKNQILSKKLGTGYGSLDYICVKREIRKKGVGLALNSAGIQYLKKSGCKNLYVKTLSHNYSAIKLLTKSGFSSVSHALILHRLK